MASEQIEKYTIFMVCKNVDDDLRRSVQNKGVFIVNSDIVPSYMKDNNHMDSITKQKYLLQIIRDLITKRNVLVEYSRLFVSNKGFFYLDYDIDASIKNSTLRVEIEYILIDNMPWDFKMPSYLQRFKLILISEFKEYVLPEDRFRVDSINAIKPTFEYFHLQDLLPTIGEYLKEYYLDDKRLTHINEWPIKWGDNMADPKYALRADKKELVRKIESKYKDFDDIILRTTDRLKNFDGHNGDSELRVTGVPCQLILKNFSRDNNKFRFTIIVVEVGKKNIWYESAGNFFVDDI